MPRVVPGTGQTLRSEQLTDAAQRVTAEIARSAFPTTEPLHFENPITVIGVLDQLSAHGSVSGDASDGGSYHLTPQQAVEAAYYRNTIVHFFVPGAIAELATLMSDPEAGVEGFWSSVAELRDLLKFEFFFADRTRFRREIIDEMDAIELSWRVALAGDREALLEGASLLRAHWALLPFLEAYLVVAHQIETRGFGGDTKQFLSECLETGRAWLDQQRIVAEESVAKPLFSSALDLAINRGIPEADPEVQAEFVASVRSAVDAARRVGELARSKNRLL